MTNETFYNELNKELKRMSKLFKMVEGDTMQELRTNLIKMCIIEQMQKIQNEKIEQLKQDNNY